MCTTPPLYRHRHRPKELLLHDCLLKHKERTNHVTAFPSACLSWAGNAGTHHMPTTGVDVGTTDGKTRPTRLSPSKSGGIAPIANSVFFVVCCVEQEVLVKLFGVGDKYVSIEQWVGDTHTVTQDTSKHRRQLHLRANLRLAATNEIQRGYDTPADHSSIYNTKLYFGNVVCYGGMVHSSREQDMPEV